MSREIKTLASNARREQGPTRRLEPRVGDVQRRRGRSRRASRGLLPRRVPSSHSLHYLSSSSKFKGTSNASNYYPRLVTVLFSYYCECNMYSVACAGGAANGPGGRARGARAAARWRLLQL